MSPSRGQRKQVRRVAVVLQQPANRFGQIVEIKIGGCEGPLEWDPARAGVARA